MKNMQIVRTALGGRAAAMLFSEILMSDAQESSAISDEGLLNGHANISSDVTDRSEDADSEPGRNGYSIPARGSAGALDR